MLNSKLKAKRLDSVIEDGDTYIIVKDYKPKNLQKNDQIQQASTNIIVKRRTTVATVLALYQKENALLKNKIIHLEAKIDKLIDDKEQMLRDELNKIEDLYNSKDRQLKNILELVNNKMMLEKDGATIHDVESYNVYEEADASSKHEIIELKTYLKTLGLKSAKKKIIKKRFLDLHDSDIRITQKDGELYLDFSKYDYSDLFAL